MATLDGLAAVVSGGLGDIGRAIVLELARRGADVALCDIHEIRAADTLLRKIEALGRRGSYDQIDVSDAGAVNAWVQRVERTLGTPGLIIPCAAVVTIANTRTLTAEVWRHELSINLDGVFHLAQAGRFAFWNRRKTAASFSLEAGRARHPTLTLSPIASPRLVCECL